MSPEIRSAVSASWESETATRTTESGEQRKVWQLAPPRLDIGGKSWPGTFERILSICAEELGCAGANVSAEIYRLLVYDEGAFFKAHRDTEKAEGMFGTLLIVLRARGATGLTLRSRGCRQ